MILLKPGCQFACSNFLCSRSAVAENNTPRVSQAAFYLFAVYIIFLSDSRVMAAELNIGAAYDNFQKFSSRKQTRSIRGVGA
jgi:hypothetical protein